MNQVQSYVFSGTTLTLQLITNFELFTSDTIPANSIRTPFCLVDTPLDL